MIRVPRGCCLQKVNRLVSLAKQHQASPEIAGYERRLWTVQRHANALLETRERIFRGRPR